jgi:molybdate transport system substrate-binding protein
MTADPKGPLSGVASMAMRHVLAQLCDAWAARTGRPVDVTPVGGVDAAARVARGDPFDFVVLAADAIERLAAAGAVDARSRTDLARSGVALAVAAGAPQPDVSTEAAARQAFAQARSVAYSTGPSGSHLLRLFARWGIADAMAPRLVQAPPGVPVASLVARGDAEFGFQQYSELLSQPGIDVIDALPPPVQVETIFSGAVCTASTRSARARELLAFLASPEGDDAKRRHGMAPAGR